MPQYIFQSGKKIKEFFFNMSEIVSIGKTVEIEGKTWTRIPSLPNTAISTVAKQDISSPQKFAEVTASKRGTYGDLLDLSKELSEKRAAQNNGVDPVAENYKKNHKKKRKGRDMFNGGVNF